MASYTATVTSPRTADDVFTYLSEFSHTSEWDPTIIESTQTAGAPRAVGATYHVVTKTKASTVELDYTTLELDDVARTIVLKGENDSMTSMDTITVVPVATGGSEVTYSAELELKGIRKIADPLLSLGFDKIGDKSKQGLHDKLNEG